MPNPLEDREDAKASIEPGQDVYVETTGQDSYVAPGQDVYLLPGQIFENRFEIISELGRGGVGVVYKAKQKHLDKLFAIKTLLMSVVGDESDFRRFEQEARTASALDHPNIIQINDFGKSGDGLAYLVMEYLDGQSLEDVLKVRGHINLARFLNVFSQVCYALQHAHRKGIIHRDVKPSNLMLVRAEDRPDFVKIVDFGLAKLTNVEQEQSLTKTGTIIGTPLYMSPEQCRGLILDNRSDIYSLGCVMYASLTGRLPIYGDTAMDTICKHLTEPPMAFEVSAPNLEIPEELQSVIFKALEKRPEDRQQSMDELADDLNGALGVGGRPARYPTRTMPAVSEESAKPYMAGAAPVVRPSPKTDTPFQPLVMWMIIGALVAGLGLMTKPWQHSAVPPAKVEQAAADDDADKSAKVAVAPPTKPHDATVDPNAAKREAAEEARLKAEEARLKAEEARFKKVEDEKYKEANDVKREADRVKRAQAKVIHDAQAEVKTHREAGNAFFQNQQWAQSSQEYAKCLTAMHIIYKDPDAPELVPILSRIIACLNAEREQGKGFLKPYLDTTLKIIGEKREHVNDVVNKTSSPTAVWLPLAIACKTEALENASDVDVRTTYAKWSVEFFTLVKNESSMDHASLEYRQMMLGYHVMQWAALGNDPALFQKKPARASISRTGGGTAGQIREWRRPR